MTDEKNIIPIALITDERLPFTVATVIVAALENASNNTFYKFHCFVTGSVREDDREKILSIQNDYKNCAIEIIDMQDKYLSSNNQHETVTNACLYKFAIAEKLPQYDKILYIDTDIIVNGDLFELFNIELHNNYIGGVFNIFYRFYKRSLIKMLDIPDLNSYFNAGVMLMNLKLIREDNLTAELEKYIGKFQESVDQHIFNKVCYGRILNIHPKYNVTMKYAEIYETEKAQLFYTKGVLEETLKNPLIFHYTGKRKPWVYNDITLSEKWFSYYKKSPYKNVDLKRKSYKKNLNLIALFNQLSYFVFKLLVSINKFWLEKLGTCNEHYKYFVMLNASLRKKNSKRILLVADNLENEKLINDITEFEKRNFDVFIILLKKNKALSKNFKNLFVVNNFNNYFMYSLRFFKVITLSGVFSYKLADKLNKKQIPYLWIIDDENKIEKKSKKNINIKRIISESRNVRLS